MILNLMNDINREYITKVNYTPSTAKENKYIVIHYVGAEGSALANVRYFQNEKRGASANVFVDHSGKMYQCVGFDDIAWHVGAKSYKHKQCRNTNSIGIEMCCKADEWDNWLFTDSTVASTVELTATLMHQYDIPIGNVLRHYDVTGKICPDPYVKQDALWKLFLKKVKQRYKELGGTYTTLQTVQLRDRNLNKVMTMDGFSNNMKAKCKQENNGVKVYKGSEFSIISVKQDDTNGNIWGFTKNGYVIPIEYNHGTKAAKL